MSGEKPLPGPKGDALERWIAAWGAEFDFVDKANAVRELAKGNGEESRELARVLDLFRPPLDDQQVVALGSWGLVALGRVFDEDTEWTKDLGARARELPDGFLAAYHNHKSNTLTLVRATLNASEQVNLWSGSVGRQQAEQEPGVRLKDTTLQTEAETAVRGLGVDPTAFQADPAWQRELMDWITARGDSRPSQDAIQERADDLAHWYPIVEHLLAEAFFLEPNHTPGKLLPKKLAKEIVQLMRADSTTPLPEATWVPKYWPTPYDAVIRDSDGCVFVGTCAAALGAWDDASRKLASVSGTTMTPVRSFGLDQHGNAAGTIQALTELPTYIKTSEDLLVDLRENRDEFLALLNFEDSTTKKRLFGPLRRALLEFSCDIEAGLAIYGLGVEALAELKEMLATGTTGVALNEPIQRSYALLMEGRARYQNHMIVAHNLVDVVVKACPKP